MPIIYDSWLTAVWTDHIWWEDNDGHYQEWIQAFVNFLDLNVIKTKEMIINLEKRGKNLHGEVEPGWTHAIVQIARIDMWPSAQLEEQNRLN